MTKTTISSFSQAADQAQAWVNELADELDWNKHRAYRLMRSVLHALRDWLPTAEMADLAAQLPVLIRGLYFDGWKPQDTPVTERKKEDFVARIENDLKQDMPNNADAAIRAVFRLLDRHISHGEIVQVRSAMKKALQDLWPSD